MKTDLVMLSAVRANRHRFAVRMFVLAGALACGSCATVDPAPARQACAATGPLAACTEQGALRGVAEGGTIAFKGIPYAKAPAGPLRWRPPQPAGGWQGLRVADRFGPVCPQLAGNEVVGEEDCLSLNVWKPERAAAGALPVMVFLTGGGNHAYSGQGGNIFGGVNYNGHALAGGHDVVYVSFNNRLGALGFLATPTLSAESPARVSGNYANLDQIAMLQWVQRNIAAFGGDPRRVTLFGTSAGGGSICGLMTAPAARGLFQAAAMQSSVPAGCEMQTLADAEQGTGRELTRRLGCEAGGAECLRGKSMQDVVRALPGTFGVFPRIYGPNMDGHVFPQQPLAAITQRRHWPMPVIIGNTTQETMLFVGGLGPVPDGPSYDAALTRVFGTANAARVRREYAPESFASPHQALVQATTDALFTCQSRRVARALADAQSQPVYRYVFGHTLDNDPEQKAGGASHTIEHAFFFPWQGTYRPTEADLAVQRTMLRSWSEFARAGSLAGQRDPVWLPVTQGRDSYLFIAPSPVLRSGSGDAHCEFWDGMTLPWPRL